MQLISLTDPTIWEITLAERKTIVALLVTRYVRSKQSDVFTPRHNKKYFIFRNISRPQTEISFKLCEL